MVVGFGAKARQGKNTAVSTIFDAYRHQYKIFVAGFGDALKEEVNALPDQYEACLRLGVAYDFNPDLTDPLCASKHGKQSKLLQAWGQLRRQENPFYWVNKVRDKILAAQPQIVLIHDVRFRNEFYFVKSVGGYCVRVRRQGFVDLSRDPNHISETDLDNAPFDVDINVLDGELDQLKRDAITVFDLLIQHETPVIPEMEGVVVQNEPMVSLT